MKTFNIYIYVVQTCPNGKVGAGPTFWLGFQLPQGAEKQLIFELWLGQHSALTTDISVGNIISKCTNTPYFNQCIKVILIHMVAKYESKYIRITSKMPYKPLDTSYLQ